MYEHEINGIPHVLIPKEDWERIWAIFDKIEKKGE